MSYSSIIFVRVFLKNGARYHFQKSGTLAALSYIRISNYKVSFKTFTKAQQPEDL
jgi:hypothetical protein